MTSGVRRAEEKVERFRNELADKEIVDQGEDLAGAREVRRCKRRCPYTTHQSLMQNRRLCDAVEEPRSSW